ncbi:MAG: hypothetical protein FWF31_04035 [Desulfobulbus sp.]|nr:hypothetical protein [Desulfobulbus sp.]
MLNINPLRILWLLCGLLLYPFSTASADGQRNIVLTLPAETVLASLQKALPLDIPSQSRQLQGNITVESVDQLAIRNNLISVRGTLSGKNLVVNTNLAGQDLQIRVGEVRLPVACDLRTRFDPVKRKLFVTPQFKDTAQDQGNAQDAQSSLLGALGGREYAVDLDALETINLKVGSRSIPIAMEPVSIAGIDNTLVFQMLPRVAPRR